MSELGDDSIYFNKNTIDSEKYFQLFDKYIPVFDKTSNILIFSISNPVAIMHMMEKNPGAHYIIVDEKETFIVVNVLIKTQDYEYACINIDDFDWYNINMKFDCIIMNPPYSKNLHLKVLEQAIKQLKDDDSVVVNLSPVRWLQDPVAQYKKTSDFNKFKETISQHIKEIITISYKDASLLFNAEIPTDLGIYTCFKNQNWNFYKTFFHQRIRYISHYECVVKYWKFPNIKKYDETTDNNFVIIKKIGDPRSSTRFKICSRVSKYWINGKTPDGTNWKESMYTCKSFSNNRKAEGIAFKTSKEVKNFYNSTFTIAYQYLVSLSKVDAHFNSKFLPWLGNAVNPRTGLKGYESEWTDEDFYKYFNITSEEQKVIEEEMEKYK